MGRHRQHRPRRDARLLYGAVRLGTPRRRPGRRDGGYGFYTKNDKAVAGYGPAQSPGVWWSMYVSVDDAAATAGKVEASGGSTIVGPMQVMEEGSMAVFADPTGAAFSVWQPGRMTGAGVVNEPGAFSWAELMTRDLEAAVTFYESVFGWTEKNGPQSTYKEFEVDGTVVAGGQTIGVDMPRKCRRTGTSTSAPATSTRLRRVPQNSAAPCECHRSTSPTSDGSQCWAGRITKGSASFSSTECLDATRTSSTTAPRPHPQQSHRRMRAISGVRRVRLRR